MRFQAIRSSEAGVVLFILTHIRRFSSKIFFKPSQDTLCKENLAITMKPTLIKMPQRPQNSFDKYFRCIICSHHAQIRFYIIHMFYLQPFSCTQMFLYGNANASL